MGAFLFREGTACHRDSRHTECLPDTIVKPPPQAWAQWISAETLISQVQNTAPFLQQRLPPRESGRLLDLGHSPDGFLRILANWENMLRPGLSYGEQLQDYFALCLACHHATVATFVPTDVDTKIRGIVWRRLHDPGVLQPMLRLALASRLWTEDGISIRAVRGVSGHHGEQWSAIAGGLGWLLETSAILPPPKKLRPPSGNRDRPRTGHFSGSGPEQRDAELDVLRLSMTLAHNRGDLTQGMGFWKRTAATRTRHGPLLSQRGSFAPRRSHLPTYWTVGRGPPALSPARSVKSLRHLLRPPCCRSARSSTLGAASWRNSKKTTRSPLAALVTGCQKIPGQQGYYRAIAGMQAASSAAFERAAAHMPNALRNACCAPPTCAS